MKKYITGQFTKVKVDDGFWLTRLLLKDFDLEYPREDRFKGLAESIGIKISLDAKENKNGK
jgi:hypothetical protein